jgi:hypothetical protein
VWHLAARGPAAPPVFGVTGGHLVFTTNVTGAAPSIAFNAHRIYCREMLTRRCVGLLCEEERFYSTKLGEFCSLEHVTREPGVWDIYCGCWVKTAT